jgi:hypothetical protein
MELITILNRCHRHRGFVYQRAGFSPDKKSIEVLVRRARIRAQSARAATGPIPGTISSSSGASSYFRCGVFRLPSLRHAARGLSPVQRGRGRRGSMDNGKCTLTRAYILFPGRAPPFLERNSPGIPNFLG